MNRVTYVVSGSVPDEIRMDGTMAYLSLPRPYSADIWLENPIVTKHGGHYPVNPYRLVDSYYSSVDGVRQIYIFERRIPGDSRTDQVICNADWFWGRKKA